MKQNIFLTCILAILFIGCGAQNHPNTDNEPIEEESLLYENEETLPQTIKIPLPIKFMENPNNEIFNQDIQRIEKNTSFIKQGLDQLKRVMPNILENCDYKSPCSIPSNDIYIKEGDKNISLGRIELKNNEITLSLNQIEHLNFKWKNGTIDITTQYNYKEGNINLHYISDSNNRESIIIHEKYNNEHNNYIIQKTNISYNIQSNHIKETSKNFSSNILLEEGIILNYNENIFPLSFKNHHLKEGNYLLLPPHTNVKNLNLIDLISLAEGSFSIFNNQLQGFLYHQTYMHNIEKLIIFHL